MERLFESINYIESRIYDPISIHDIAKASHYSTYHFCRMFRALVGDSPKEYLRKRRLTIAAGRLLKEKIGILDIALDCQFESQEAFTRSFKQLFKITPGQYRKKADPFKLIYKDQFSPQMLHHLQNRIDMEPEIITRSEIKAVGVAGQYNEEHLDYVKLWSAFMPFFDRITNRVGTNIFGIYEEYNEGDDGVGFTYICAAEVENFDDVPEGMTTRIIPEHLYAVFKHKGKASTLPETLKYIWGSWLPKSNYEYVEKPDFELYSEKVLQYHPPEFIGLYIPIKEKKIATM